MRGQLDRGLACIFKGLRDGECFIGEVLVRIQRRRRRLGNLHGRLQGASGEWPPVRMHTVRNGGRASARYVG
eukprot:scaffold17928_cov67-Phaeocystis_antarctica.AAC.3